MTLTGDWFQVSEVSWETYGLYIFVVSPVPLQPEKKKQTVSESCSKNVQAVPQSCWSCCATLIHACPHVVSSFLTVSNVFSRICYTKIFVCLGEDFVLGR